jgi:MFS family permease
MNPPAGIRSAIILLALAAFFSGAALRICDGLIPRLASDFGRTPGAAGAVVLTFSIAYGLAQLAFGPLGDRFGKPRLILVALAGCAAASLACALAPGFDALVGLRIFWGAAAAGIIPLSMAWIGDAIPYEQRQATLARFLMGTLSGMMAGQLAGGLFADAAWG